MTNTKGTSAAIQRKVEADDERVLAEIDAAWKVVYDILESLPEDTSFCAVTDDIDYGLEDSGKLFLYIGTGHTITLAEWSGLRALLESLGEAYIVAGKALLAAQIPDDEPEKTEGATDLVLRNPELQP